MGRLEFALQIPPALRDGFGIWRFHYGQRCELPTVFRVHEYMRFRY